MHFLPVMMNVDRNEVPENHYVVVHPLHDLPEEKVDASKLGRIKMTRSVKLSLLALRAYLAVMTLLVIYHVIDLAGVLGQPSR